MSAEAGFDFNMQAIRMGLGMNKGGGGGDPVANEKDMLEYLFDSIGSGGAGITTTLTGAPNNEGLLNTGITKPFEIPEGLHEKMINPFASSFSSPGGFLYKVFSALIKNSKIESQIEGIEALEVGASDYGDSGSGGDSGGGGSSSGGEIYGEGGMPMGDGGSVEPLYVDYGGHRYEVSGVGESLLGGLTPSAGSDLGGVGRGDIEIA